MKIFVRLCVLVIVLSGCFPANILTPPLYHMPENADVGPYPENYEQLAKDYISKALKRPQALTIKSISRPSKNWTGDPIKKERVFGYSIVLHFIVPGQTYVKTMHLFLRDGKILGNFGGSPGAILSQDEYKKGFSPQEHGLFGNSICCGLD